VPECDEKVRRARRASVEVGSGLMEWICYRMGSNKINVMQAAFMPLALLCNQNPMKRWLQMNHPKLAPHYKKLSEIKPEYDYYPDEDHSKMVRKSNLDLQSLMARLQKGDIIYQREKQPKKRRIERYKIIPKAWEEVEDEKSKHSLRVVGPRVPDLSWVKRFQDMAPRPATGIEYRKLTVRLPEEGPKRRASHEDMSAEGAKRVYESYWPVRRKHVLTEDSEDKTPKSKRREEFKEGYELFGITEDSSSEEEVSADLWDLGARSEVLDRSEEEPLVDEVEQADGGGKEEERESEGGVERTEVEESEEVGREDMVEEREGSDGEGDLVESEGELEERLQILKDRLLEVTECYEQEWLKEASRNYPSLQLTVGDVVKLMRRLPEMESRCLADLFEKWTLLEERIIARWTEYKERRPLPLSKIQAYLDQNFPREEKVIGEERRKEENSKEKEGGLGEVPSSEEVVPGKPVLCKAEREYEEKPQSPPGPLIIRSKVVKPPPGFENKTAFVERKFLQLERDR
jgi:hypothetical protein